MITDKLLLLSDGQAITADAASTNSIDFGAANVGDGEDLRLVVVVSEAFNNLTSMVVKLQSDTSSALGSATDDYTSASIALASLTAGAKIVDIRLPRGVKRYVQAYYDITGTAPSTGKVKAYIVADSENRKTYASGYTTGH